MGHADAKATVLSTPARPEMSFIGRLRVRTAVGRFDHHKHDNVGTVVATDNDPSEVRSLR
jgi:hypothetical protein